MPHIWFRACPRCAGDLHAQADIYGNYITCLQCGYSLDQSESTKLYDRLVKPSKDKPNPHPTHTQNKPTRPEYLR